MSVRHHLPRVFLSPAADEAGELGTVSFAQKLMKKDRSIIAWKHSATGTDGLSVKYLGPVGNFQFAQGTTLGHLQGDRLQCPGRIRYVVRMAVDIQVCQPDPKG